MLIHGFNADGGHDDGRAGLALRTDGAKHIRRLKAAIAGCTWTRAAPGPDPCQRALLAHPGFIATPDLHRLTGRLRRQRRGYESRKLSLKDACASGSLFGCCGRTESRRNDSLRSNLPIVRSCKATPKLCWIGCWGSTPPHRPPPPRSNSAPSSPRAAPSPCCPPDRR